MVVATFERNNRVFDAICDMNLEKTSFNQMEAQIRVKMSILFKFWPNRWCQFGHHLSFQAYDHKMFNKSNALLTHTTEFNSMHLRQSKNRNWNPPATELCVGCVINRNYCGSVFENFSVLHSVPNAILCIFRWGC